jgi:hypothetical protein
VATVIAARPRRLRRIGAATAAVVLLGPAPALAADRYVGRTSQNRLVGLTTDSSGRAALLAIDWLAPCRGGGAVARGTTFQAPFAHQGRRSFRGGGTYRVVRRDGSVLRVRVRAAGARRSDGRWSGSLRVALTVERGGRVATRCATPRVAWSVARVG